MPRIQSKSALAAAIGVSVAMSSSHVPASLFDGVASSPEEAKEMAFRVNIERDRAKFAAKAKGGLAAMLGGA